MLSVSAAISLSRGVVAAWVCGAVAVLPLAKTCSAWSAMAAALLVCAFTGSVAMAVWVPDFRGAAVVPLAAS